jgi:hypothetical protein
MPLAAVKYVPSDELVWRLITVAMPAIGFVDVDMSVDGGVVVVVGAGGWGVVVGGDTEACCEELQPAAIKSITEDTSSIFFIRVILIFKYVLSDFKYFPAACGVHILEAFHFFHGLFHLLGRVHVCFGRFFVIS